MNIIYEKIPYSDSCTPARGREPLGRSTPHPIYQVSTRACGVLNWHWHWPDEHTFFHTLHRVKIYHCLPLHYANFFFVLPRWPLLHRVSTLSAAFSHSASNASPQVTSCLRCGPMCGLSSLVFASSSSSPRPLTRNVAPPYNHFPHSFRHKSGTYSFSALSLTISVSPLPHAGQFTPAVASVSSSSASFSFTEWRLPAALQTSAVTDNRIFFPFALRSSFAYPSIAHTPIENEQKKRPWGIVLTPFFIVTLIRQTDTDPTAPIDYSPELAYWYTPTLSPFDRYVRFPASDLRVEPPRTLSHTKTPGPRLASV